ncbi:MAG TPA: hypothetical protein VM692_03950, partial [Gammaproteobacteria bacterium]|nr:hypothetical protein [Gammaproteobacteria bacterium]
VARGADHVVVEHGSWVETGESFFAEGAWNGPFGEPSLGDADIVLGSGGTLVAENVAFTPTTHTMERLYSHESPTAVLVANSLPFLLEACQAKLDLRNWSYERQLMTFLRGYKKAVKRLELAGGATVQLHYHDTLLIGPDLRQRVKHPPAPPRFACYGAYVDYLTRSLGTLHRNASSPQRAVAYTPLSTISSGYDSPACAVLAKRLGCRRTVTFSHAREDFNERPLKTLDDSGEHIAKMLELDVTTFSRNAYLAADDYPEALFIATGSGGDDVVMSVLRETLEGTMLFTGMLGDTLWSTHDTQSPELSEQYRFLYPAGGSLQEFRLQTGFVHVPVPLLTFTRHADLRRISNSLEMRQWRVGGHYDRPIPRRLVEDEGVPRRAYAREKRAISQPFWLQKSDASCMSARSLRDLEAFRRRAAARYAFGELRMRINESWQRAAANWRKRVARLARDPYHSDAYLDAGVADPLRFHWAVEKVAAAYRGSELRTL